MIERQAIDSLCEMLETIYGYEHVFKGFTLIQIPIDQCKYYIISDCGENADKKRIIIYDNLYDAVCSQELIDTLQDDEFRNLGLFSIRFPYEIVDDYFEPYENKIGDKDNPSFYQIYGNKEYIQLWENEKFEKLKLLLLIIIEILESYEFDSEIGKVFPSLDDDKYIRLDLTDDGKYKISEKELKEVD